MPPDFASSFPKNDLSGVKEQTLEMMAAAKEKASKQTQSLREYVTSHPAIALGVAFGIGALLGWFIKRR